MRCVTRQAANLSRNVAYDASVDCFQTSSPIGRNLLTQMRDYIETAPDIRSVIEDRITEQNYVSHRPLNATSLRKMSAADFLRADASIRVDLRNRPFLDQHFAVPVVRRCNVIQRTADPDRTVAHSFRLVPLNS